MTDRHAGVNNALHVYQQMLVLAADDAMHGVK